jgi:chaperonin GroES
MLNIQPTHDLVYLKKKDVPSKSAGGILLSGNVKQQDNIGKVVAVGPGKTYSNGNLIPLVVKIGDEVIYSKHAGQSFNVEGQELIALREDDIYAIINDDTN